MATTYAELVTEVASFLHRSDLAATVPSFISLAEAKFNRELRVEQMIDTHTDTITTDEITLPADFLEATSLNIGDIPYEFKPRTQFFVLEGYFYTRVGNSLRLASDISESTDISLDYYAAIPALQTNSTNWLLTSSPDLYLYSALLEAVPYMRLAMDDPRPGQWAAGRAAVLASMAAADEKSRFSGQQLTISIPR